MSIWPKLADLFGPITNLIDDLHTSDEERLQAKASLLQLQTAIILESLDYEKAAVQLQAENIQAEVRAESWLTRSWRPIAMLVFVSLIVLNWFGVGPETLPPDLWTVIKLGLGGYVVGRSAEKTVPAVIAALKDSERA